MTRRPPILVVEDEPLSREMLIRALEGRDFAAEGVHDGPACLEWLEHHVPALILLDVSMPGMSGLDVLRTIRQRWSADQLPVILVSALIDSDDVIAGLEAEANDYVVKPVNLPVLMARIGVCLRMKRSIERLIEAERHRVLLEQLGRACAQIARPMAAVTDQLESLLRELPDDPRRMRQQLADVLEWSRRASELIGRFQTVAEYRKVPYTEGIGGFVDASLEQIARSESGDSP